MLAVRAPGRSQAFLSCDYVVDRTLPGDLHGGVPQAFFLGGNKINRIGN